MTENQLSMYGHMMPFLTFDPFNKKTNFPPVSADLSVRFDWYGFLKASIIVLVV